MPSIPTCHLCGIHIALSTVTTKATLRPLKRVATKKRRSLTREQREALADAARNLRTPAPAKTTYVVKPRLQYAPITQTSNGHTGYQQQESTTSWRDLYSQSK